MGSKEEVKQALVGAVMREDANWHRNLDVLHSALCIRKRYFFKLKPMREELANRLWNLRKKLIKHFQDLDAFVSGFGTDTEWNEYCDGLMKRFLMGGTEN